MRDVVGYRDVLATKINCINTSSEVFFVSPEACNAMLMGSHFLHGDILFAKSIKKGAT